MDSSTVAKIYIIALAVFFVFLIIMTVTLIVHNAKKGKENIDDYDDLTDDPEELPDDLDPEEQNNELSDEQEDVYSADNVNISTDLGGIIEVAEDDYSDSAFTDADIMSMGDSAFSQADYDDKVAADDYSDSAFAVDAFVDDDDDDESYVNTNSAFDDITINPKNEYADTTVSTSEYEEDDDDEYEDDEVVGDTIPLEEINKAVQEAEQKSILEQQKLVEQKTSKEVNESEKEPVGTKELHVEEKKTVEKKEFVNPFKRASKTDENTTTEKEMDTEEDISEEEAKAALAENISTDDMDLSDSAFAVESESVLSNEAIDASVKEAAAIGAAATRTSIPDANWFGMADELAKYDKKKTKKKTIVGANEDFFWFNRMDVEDRPSYKTPEMFYHNFNIADDCIEDLLMEMYDCALVRTEEIRYIAYGIQPRAVSLSEIMKNGNANYNNEAKLKEPTAEDMVVIYEKWCGYVEKLFDVIEIHADEYTTNEIKNKLREFGRNDVEVLLEGK